MLAPQNEEPNPDWLRNTDVPEIVSRNEIADIIFRKYNRKYVCCLQATKTLARRKKKSLKPNLTLTVDQWPVATL